MKRYDHNSYSMDEKADGDWVEHFEAAAEIATLKAGIAEMRAALIRHYDQEWDIGDGISDDDKVKFLIGQVPK